MKQHFPCPVCGYELGFEPWRGDPGLGRVEDVEQQLGRHLPGRRRVEPIGKQPVRLGGVAGRRQDRERPLLLGESQPVVLELPGVPP